MLALETGWTPDVLAALPLRFRAACHWVLYTRALVGPEGLPDTTVPIHADPQVKAAAIKLRQNVEAIRAILFPEDSDGNA